MKFILLLNLLFCVLVSPNFAQTTFRVSGTVSDSKTALPGAHISLNPIKHGTHTDTNGDFSFELPSGTYQILVSFIGYKKFEQTLEIENRPISNLNIQLEIETNQLEEVVVTGSFKPVTRLESPIPVDVYSMKFLGNNAPPTLGEVVTRINGVRPQINCSVCNTADIRINGMDGAYTMIMINSRSLKSI